MKQIDLTIPQIVALTEVSYPNAQPLRDITLVMVLWNESTRIGPLLDELRPWFESMCIVVQKSDDDTLEIVKSYALPGDKVLIDEHHGHGDASMPRAIDEVQTTWSFVLAGDESPDPELLGSMQSAMALAELHHYDAYWLPFVSFIEGVPAKDTDSGHLRLFHSRLGWPKSMHSRPVGNNEAWWPFGYVTHTRSLDEMIRDYLRYISLDTDLGRIRHDLIMMHDACAGIAAAYGWDYVMQYEWWPEVKAMAFAGEEIDGDQEDS